MSCNQNVLLHQIKMNSYVSLFIGSVPLILQLKWFLGIWEEGSLLTHSYVSFHVPSDIEKKVGATPTLSLENSKHNPGAEPNIYLKQDWDKGRRCVLETSRKLFAVSRKLVAKWEYKMNKEMPILMFLEFKWSWRIASYKKPWND